MGRERERETDAEKAKSGTRRTVLTESRVVGVTEADSERRKLHTHTHTQSTLAALNVACRRKF